MISRIAGIASVYRALELLVDTKLVQRLEMGDGVARFEPAFADGSQHHHLVCERCHLVVPFSDEPLEEAIDRLAERLGFSFEHREIVLRGDCASCREAVRA